MSGANKKENQNWLTSLGFYTMVNQGVFFAISLRNGLSGIWSNSVVKYLNAPVAILFSAASIILSWRQVYLEKASNKHSLLAAIVETLAGGAMIAAAVGILAAMTLFSFIAPILFVAATALKTIFSIGSACYYAYQIQYGQQHKRELNQEKCKEAAIDAGAYALLCAVGVTLMLVAAPVVQMVMVGLGIIASLAGVIAVCVKLTRATRNQGENFEAPVGRPLTNNARVVGRVYSGQPQFVRTDEPIKHNLNTIAGDTFMPLSAVTICEPVKSYRPA